MRGRSRDDVEESINPDQKANHMHDSRQADEGKTARQFAMLERSYLLKLIATRDPVLASRSDASIFLGNEGEASCKATPLDQH